MPPLHLLSAVKPACELTMPEARSAVSVMLLVVLPICSSLIRPFRRVWSARLASFRKARRLSVEPKVSNNRGFDWKNNLFSVVKTAVEARPSVSILQRSIGVHAESTRSPRTIVSPGRDAHRIAGGAALRPWRGKWSEEWSFHSLKLGWIGWHGPLG